ncbi:hypothetical protein G7Z17_g10889 [Cylindrodendrum hubeiense]|uniref:CCHC-type domain-containing protein n=1 Tax=Cylindrodendrum hubeiense TaxID=595255 RepID=A0A9P5H525_9HYPO|nr:hypothetical protein G7Z17_g10889 [Cylindrodendrum hubeiense]
MSRTHPSVTTKARPHKTNNRTKSAPPSRLGMADWNSGPEPSWDGGGSTSNNFGGGATSYGFDDAGARANGFDQNSQPGADFDQGNGNGDGNGDDKCFGCGEAGAECPNAQEMTCRFWHMRKNCENARKINRDHVATVTPDEAWTKLKQAVSERDVDDAKEAVQEYIKALDGNVTYRELQEALIEQGISLWLIATEKPLISIFTNMNLQGAMGKKYTVSYRFSEKPDRPREIDGWPQDRAEILSRLDDAGDVVDKGVPLCFNCKELGHSSKYCEQEKVERTDAPKISCYNCNGPEPRVDKFACKNCGKSGHKIAECEEPPNPENVECRKCNEMGHFAKDCPQGGSRACRNCGQEGHMSKECDQPRNMDTVTCRNCEKTGHFSRECPEPRDWSKVQCSNCQEFGHTKVRCKAPPAEGDGGFSNDGFPAPSNDGFPPNGGFPSNDGGGDNANSYGGDTHDAGGW